MGHPLRNFWQFFLTGSGQVTELWRHKRNSLRPTFQGCHWLEWGHYAWFRSAHDHMWPLTLHNDLPKVIRGHWSWLTPYIPIMDNLAVFGVSWDPETEYGSNFLHGHVYSASLHCPRPIRVIDPVYPQAIFPMGWRCLHSDGVWVDAVYSKVEKLPISRKFYLWPPKTGSNFDVR